MSLAQEDVTGEGGLESRVTDKSLNLASLATWTD